MKNRSRPPCALSQRAVQRWGGTTRAYPGDSMESNPPPTLDALIKTHNATAIGFGRELEKMDVIAMLREQAAACPSDVAAVFLHTAIDNIRKNLHRVQT